MLAGKGLIAWTRVLAELTPTSITPPAAPTRAPASAPAPALPAALTRELVNILAALTLVPT